MKRLSFLAAILLTAGPLSAQSSFIAVSFNGNVYTISPTTGRGSLLGNSGVAGLNALATDGSGNLFAAGGSAMFPSADLITISPATGLVGSHIPLSLGGQSVSIRGLAFSSAGVLYAINNGGDPASVSDPDNLYTINPITGAGTLIGNTGLPGIQGLDFSPQGVLYGWEVGSGSGVGLGLVTIDPITGLATDVNPSIGGAIAVQSIVFGPDGNLYGAGDALYRIDVASGATTLIGSGGYSDIRGIEAVPEPATIGLMFSAACLAAILLGRRQKHDPKCDGGGNG